MKRIGFLVAAMVAVATVHAAGAKPKSAAETKPNAAESKNIESKNTATSGSNTAVKVKQEPFGATSDGKSITLYTCTNSKGLVLKLTNYGAFVTGVETPDRQGKLAEITLGFKTLDEYVRHKAHFGGTIGRYGNRIAKGKFTLEGKEYQLATNIPPNHLHGGPLGFDHVVWKGEPIEKPGVVGAKFTYHSPDGDEGYPGALDATVAYTLDDDNELKMEYWATTTDKPTIINLTNHCYWNLAGGGDVLGQQMMIAADRYVLVDTMAIPNGELAPVAGTVMDFTHSHAIGDKIEQVNNGPDSPRGYDHCYVLRGNEGKLALAARVKDPKSGRVMEVFTTEPGIQFYTGNYLDGDPINGGFKQHAAFCLEAQHFPDSPNQPKFPSTELKPGQQYHQLTMHKFFAE